MKYMSTYHLLTDDKRLENRFIVTLFNIIIATFSKEKIHLPTGKSYSLSSTEASEITLLENGCFSQSFLNCENLCHIQTL